MCLWIATKDQRSEQHAQVRPVRDDTSLTSTLHYTTLRVHACSNRAALRGSKPTDDNRIALAHCFVLRQQYHHLSGLGLEHGIYLNTHRSNSIRPVEKIPRPKRSPTTARTWNVNRDPHRIPAKQS